MRLLAIGDVHGSFERLSKLLDKVALQPDDQLVMLGDYIDRGPDSKRVIDLLRKLRKDFPKTVFLRGNHEQMLLDALYELGLLVDWKPLRTYEGSPDLSRSRDIELFEMNAGHTTLSSYGVNPAELNSSRERSYQMIPREHVLFLKETDLYYRHEDFLFVHAGINDQDPLGEKFGPFDLLWNRRFGSCVVDGRELTVVHGHTPRQSPLLEKKEINLDTGAGYGRMLTGCDVLTREIWQV